MTHEGELVQSAACRHPFEGLIARPRMARDLGRVFQATYCPTREFVLDVGHQYIDRLIANDRANYLIELSVQPDRYSSCREMQFNGQTVRLPSLLVTVDCTIKDPQREIPIKDYFFVEGPDTAYTEFIERVLPLWPDNLTDLAPRTWVVDEWRARGMDYLREVGAALTHLQQTFLVVRMDSALAAQALAEELHSRAHVLVVKSRQQAEENELRASEANAIRSGRAKRITNEEFEARERARDVEHYVHENGDFVWSKPDYLAHKRRLKPVTGRCFSKFKF